MLAFFILKKFLIWGFFSPESVSHFLNLLRRLSQTKLSNHYSKELEYLIQLGKVTELRGNINICKKIARPILEKKTILARLKFSSTLGSLVGTLQLQTLQIVPTFSFSSSSLSIFECIDTINIIQVHNFNLLFDI